jgi:hypothetical protein
MKYFIISLLLFVMAVFIGCASVQKVKIETAIKPQQEKTREPAALIQVKHDSREEKYTVKHGDSLWEISAKHSIYGDPFEWPLLFRSNRDQITDPDIIEVNQQLSVDKSFDKDIMKDARQEAEDTPPYIAHAEPRKTLPLRY